MKAKAHTIYEVERVIEAKEDKDALQRAVEGPGLESEQVLRLRIEGGRSIDDAFGSLAVFEAALARALPPAASSRTCIPWKGAKYACGSVSTRSPPWPNGDDVLSAELRGTPAMPLPVAKKPSTPGGSRLKINSLI